MIALHQIHEALKGQSDDARYTAWAQLYQSSESEAFEECERIVGGTDPILKILFCRFLSHQPEEKAISFLVRMFEDRNSVVFEATRKAFTMNRFDKKLSHLVPLVSSKVRPASFYAIKQVAMGGHIQALSPILELIPGADPELLKVILGALRYLPDRRLLWNLEDFFSHRDEEIRSLTVLVYGAMAEENIRKAKSKLKMALYDTAPGIRQLSIWCLGRKYGHENLQDFMHFAKNDPDPKVRLEALSALSSFHKTWVVEFIIYQIVEEKDWRVLLKAWSVLLGFNGRVLLRGLKRALSSKNEAVQHRAVLYLAEYKRGHRGFYVYLTRQLIKAKKDRTKIVYLEALGIFGHLQAIPLLKKYLSENFLLAYTAMASILLILGHHRSIEMLPFLENPLLKPVLKQMVLRKIIKIELGRVYPEQVTTAVMGFLSDTTVNIRYLAAQVLVMTGQEQIVRPLFLMLLQETDASALKYLKESLLELVKKNPQMFLRLVASYRTDSKAVGFMIEVLDQTTWQGNQFLELIPLLFEAPLHLLDSSHAEKGMALVIKQMMAGSFGLLDLLTVVGELENRELFIDGLVRSLRQQPFEGGPLPMPLLETWFAEENGNMNRLLIELMGLSRYRGAIPLLVHFLCESRGKPYQPTIVGALRNLASC